MYKGFPRPRITVEKFSGSWTYAKVEDNPDAIKHEIEKGEGKEYPHPFSASDSNISILDNARVYQCATQKLCIVCGEFVFGEKVWVYYYGGDLQSDAGPIHEKCMRLTENLCPAMRVDQTHGEPGRIYEWREVVWRDVQQRIIAKCWVSDNNPL